MELVRLNPPLNTLHLTPAQITVIEESDKRYHRNVRDYEASVAVVDPVGDQVLIDIPPFPAEGKVLLEALRKDLAAGLGPELADAVLAQYASEIGISGDLGGSWHRQFLVGPDTDNPGRTKVVESSEGDGTKMTAVGSLSSTSDLDQYGALGRFFPPMNP